LFILFVLACSLVIALARGGRLDRLVNLPVRWLWLFFIPLLLQLVIFTPLVKLIGNGETWVPLVHIASLLLAALALALNRHLPGVSWIAAGLTLNLIVIALNGGLMPVSAAARQFAGQAPLHGSANNVILMTPDTVLWFLGDILPLPAWLPLANVYSIGDVLVTLGGVILTQQALTCRLCASRL